MKKPNKKMAIIIIMALGVVGVASAACMLIFSSSATLDIDSTAPAMAFTANFVGQTLDATAGADSQVSLTEGAGITLTQTSATEITVAATATGTTVVKDQFTGDNSTTVFALSTAPSSVDNVNVYISGVYQNSLDASGTANYSITGTTNITFTTAPPTTAANGIEVVITQ